MCPPSPPHFISPMQTCMHPPWRPDVNILWVCTAPSLPPLSLSSRDERVNGGAGTDHRKQGCGPVLHALALEPLIIFCEASLVPLSQFPEAQGILNLSDVRTRIRATRGPHSTSEPTRATNRTHARSCAILLKCLPRQHEVGNGLLIIVTPRRGRQGREGKGGRAGR